MLSDGKEAGWALEAACCRSCEGRVSCQGSCFRPIGCLAATGMFGLEKQVLIMFL